MAFWPLPDEPNTVFHSLAAFGLFAVFLTSAFGYGFYLARLLIGRSSLWAALAAGTAALAWIMEVRSVLHTLGSHWRALDLLILAGGLALLFREWRREPRAFRIPRLSH